MGKRVFSMSAQTGNFHLGALYGPYTIWGILKSMTYPIMGKENK